MDSEGNLVLCLATLRWQLPAGGGLGLPALQVAWVWSAGVWGGCRCEVASLAGPPLLLSNAELITGARNGKCPEAGGKCPPPTSLQRVQGLPVSPFPPNSYLRGSGFGAGHIHA